MSLVFYSTCTTGTATYFDQILHFAAIRTDTRFEEIDRFEIRCRLLPDVVPTLHAMRVGRFRANQFTDPANPSHYEMVRAIREKFLAWSPCTFIGWNSLAFDERVVRQALYRTLHTPYLTNREGNSRTDAMRMTQSAMIFAPATLAVPDDQIGTQTLALDRIAVANGINGFDTHHPMGNVETTIAVCRLLNDRAPEVVSSSMRFSAKRSVTDFIGNELVFCFSDFFFGKPYSWFVTTLGQNPNNLNEWYAYNLSIRPEILAGLGEAELIERLQNSPKPLRRLTSNAAPILCSSEDAPPIARGLELGLAELERRALYLHGDEGLCRRMISAYESLRPIYPKSIHVERQIYDGFFDRADETLMDAFHAAEWHERTAIVDQFQDPRLRLIGHRLIYVERPDLVGESQTRRHLANQANRLLGRCEEVDWMTLTRALAELSEFSANPAYAQDSSLLREYEQYLRMRYSEATDPARQIE